MRWADRPTASDAVVSYTSASTVPSGEEAPLYRNAQRLGEAVASLVRQFGLDALLADAKRARGLLLDEYGAAGRTEAADIELFVSALGPDAVDLLDPFEPVESAAKRLAARTSLSTEDASWTVTTLRAVRSVRTPAPPPPPPPPPPASPTVLDSGPIGTSDPSGSSVGTWPANARRVLAAVGAVALAAVIALVAVIVTGGDDEGDGEAASTTTETLTPTTEAEESADADQDRAGSSGTDLAGVELDSLQARVEEQEAILAEYQAEIDRLAAANATLTEQLASAEAAASNPAGPPPPSPPFSVDPAGVAPSPLDFSGTVNLLECVGFSDECEPSLVRRAQFQREGEQWFLNLPNTARVPLGSFDGLNFAGEAPAIESASFTCNGAPSATTVKVQASPVRFTVDPGPATVSVTAYNVNYTKSSTGASCTDAHYTYVGTLTAP